MKILKFINNIGILVRRQLELDPALLILGMVMFGVGVSTGKGTLVFISLVFMFFSHVVALWEEIYVLKKKLKRYRDTLTEASQDEIDLANNVLMYAKEVREMKEVERPDGHTIYESHMVVLNPKNNAVDAVPFEINPN